MSPFPCSSFALRRYNLCFCERVSPNGHHRGMKYFVSDVLLVVSMYFFSFVLADSPKNIGPSLFLCMMTSIVPILITSLLVVLLALVASIVDTFSPCPAAVLVGLGGQVF
jgi:hypothetical protein